MPFELAAIDRLCLLVPLGEAEVACAVPIASIQAVKPFSCLIRCYRRVVCSSGGSVKIRFTLPSDVLQVRAQWCCCRP